ncbi:polysaccharide pyruvyl transferase CsaB [Alkalihalophilus marmarensis]|uniref:CsaB protein n=1 Tax=Alkalihalophilus marmarensis DSM 21297 TaxID=1188261 RepID=U6SM67_9BACI|nr:polysaccharide pyruvyl transferase CsaB [Alkalihalophilus marmarensis]ERN52000.1 CsaB protein [Alkalihalophilus marmarensis DSM 21297]
MRLVLSGYYGFDNVGDEAILFSIISALREQQPDIKLTVLSNQPEKTAETYQVDAVDRWKLKDVSAAIKRADGVISGGGSLLQDKTGNRSVVYYSGIMWLAKLHKKPFFVYAQGIGPVSKGFNQKIVKSTVSKSSLLTVRDHESEELLKQFGVTKEIKLVPDPVLGITRPNGSEQAEGEIKRIAVSVRDWPSEYPFKEEIAKGLDQVADRGYMIRFIPMHGEHDHNASKDVAELMRHDADIMPHDGEIQEKIQWIEDCDLLVGMRLHALIFAAVVDTPFVALSYDPKIDSFASLCKQPVAAHVNEKWEAIELVEAMNRQLEDLGSALEKMKQYTDHAKEKARHTAKLVVDSIK